MGRGKNGLHKMMSEKMKGRVKRRKRETYTDTNPSYMRKGRMLKTWQEVIMSGQIFFS